MEVVMKPYVKTFIIGMFFLAVIGLALTSFTGLDKASACGAGSPGGQDYVPKRRGPTGPLARKPALTKEQAYKIVANHIRRLNPNLEVGKINDAGSFYEAEILSENKELVQRMGVDKLSGRLMFIN
jgi:hypothetical protein